MNTAHIQNPNMQDISANLSRLLATGTVKQEQIGELLSNFASQIMQQVQNLVPVKPAAPHIFEALSAMQKEVSETGIAKDSSATNTNGKTLYKFRGIDDVYNLLSPLFAAHGITVGINCLSKEKEMITTKNSVQHQTTVLVEYSFISRVDGSKHSITMYGEAADHSDKGLSKALSMAFKYACFQMLCIPVCEDPDATVHDKIPANDYQSNSWTRNNAQQSNKNHSFNNGQNNGNSNRNSGNNGQNNGNANSNSGNHGQNNGNANHGAGNPGQHTNHGQSNGQNNNNQNHSKTITPQQANFLLNKLSAAGADPSKILKNHNIQNLSQLAVKTFEGLVKRLDTHLNEQQLINQQNGDHNGHHQGYYS